MGAYVQLGNVKTWYDEHGAGDPLVLMHGGLVDARFFAPNLGPLAEHFHVYTPERRGHGHTPDVEGPITYQLMADDTIAFLETVVGEPADVVGHSDGAFTAMLVAMQRPELVKRLGDDQRRLQQERRGDARHGVGRRPDLRVPRPDLRRGVARRHRPLQGRGDEDRRDGREGAEPPGRPTSPTCPSARW